MSLLLIPHFFMKYSKDTQKWFCSVRFCGLLLAFTVQDLSCTENCITHLVLSFCGAKLALIKSTVGSDVLCVSCCRAPVGGQSLASLFI